MVIKNVTLKDGGLLYRNGKELEGVLNGAKVGGILNAHKLFSPRHRWIPPATGALKQFFQIKGAGNYCIATDPDNAYIDASIVAYNTALVKSTVGSMACFYQLALAQVGNYVVSAGNGRASFSFGQAAYAISSTLTLSAVSNTGDNRGALSAVGKKGGAHALFAGGFTQDRSPWGVSTFCKAYSSALVLSTPDQLSSARWRMWAGWVGNYFIFGYGTGERGNLDNRQVQVVDAYNASLVRSTASKPSTVNGATGTINNNLILAGGRDSSFNLLSSAERYNSSLSLASISELSEAKECQGATCLLNFLLFAGGVKTISSPFILTQKVDAYDKTLTRASAPDLSVPCNPIPGDMVGIYGLIGENRIINSSGAYISSAELEAYIEE